MTELELPMQKHRHDVTMRLPDDPDTGDTAELAHRFPASHIPDEGTILYDHVDLETEIDAREVNSFTEFSTEGRSFNSTQASKDKVEYLRVVLVGDDDYWTVDPNDVEMATRYGSLDSSAWTGYITDTAETIKVKRSSNGIDTHRSYSRLKIRIEREFVEMYELHDLYVVTWERSVGGSAGSRGNDPSSHHTIKNLRVTELQLAEQ